MSASHIGIIVLAAGASSRMSEPKQLLRFENETLLRRAVNAALQTKCRPAIVVLGAKAEQLSEEVSDLETQIVINQAWQEGMSSSIRYGIGALEAATSGKAQAAILMLCDQPFVTPIVINRLIENYHHTDAAIVACEYGTGEDKTRGVPALFSRLLFPALLQLRGEEGAKRIILQHASQVSAVTSPEAATDVDSPSDYRNLGGQGHST